MQELTSIDEWSKILKQSKQTPVIIFKHSDTCPISEAAHERVEDGITKQEITEPVYRVTVQESKDLSNKIASELRVEHESPQAVVLKRGIAVFTASHDDININGLTIALRMQ